MYVDCVGMYVITYTIKEHCTYYYFTKRIFLLILCNDHVVLISDKLLMHAEFNQFYLFKFDNDFQPIYGYLI